MPIDQMQVAWDVAKIAVGGVVGFFAGHYQGKASQKANRVRDCQQNTIKLTRAMMVDAVRHFSTPLTDDERIASCALLKSHMKTLSTDTAYLADLLGKTSEIYLTEYALFFDAVTKYPFETFGKPNFAVDHVRVDEIAMSGEAYAVKLYKLCS